MKIKIPYNRREMVDGKVVNNHGEIDAVVDMTVLAEERWQQKFPVLAKEETIFAYTTRINAIPKTPATLVARILSGIKAMYCFIETDLDFKSFARLFDVSDIETLDKQKAVLEAAFAIINEGSAVSAKN